MQRISSWSKECFIMTKTDVTAERVSVKKEFSHGLVSMLEKTNKLFFSVHCKKNTHTLAKICTYEFDVALLNALIK